MMKPTIQHRGRELLNAMGMLTRCLTIPNCDSRQRADWKRGLHDAGRDLEALYAGGLRRDFVPEAISPQTTADHIPAPPVGGAERVQTGLEPWQRKLILRLEHGLARPLGLADMACISWNPAAKTMSVAARPLLGELRAMNLTSNVFRS